MSRQSPAREEVAVADTRCPFCDHVFVAEEITDEWCAGCGKKIPEVLLKDVRPKPHIRNPHPHPLPPPSQAALAERAHETKLRVVGLLVILGAIVLAIAAAGWGTYNEANTREIGVLPWVVGGIALAVFLAGAVMLARGRDEEQVE